MKVKNTKRLGELAMEEGAITPAQLDACLAIQRAVAELGVSKKLGEVMVEKGHIAPTRLDQLLRLQRDKHQVRTLGDYELGAKLGQGGMGAVLRATRISDRVEVALKFLSKELASRPTYVERFEREARIASTLFHPNVVRCYGVERLDGHHVLALELVEGLTLERLIRTDGPMAERTALRIALQVAQALAYLGSKRIVHRDIKPSNVMIDEAGNAKLLDLGLARHEDSDSPITMTGQVIGTPDFMAPEQIKGGVHDTRTDVYALGATLYMMVTGLPPYAGRGDHQAILMGHLAGNYRDPRELAPTLSAGCTHVIAKAMAVDPDQRYGEMEAFALDLEAVIRGLAPRTATDAPTRADPSKPTSGQLPAEPAGASADPSRPPIDEPPKAAASRARRARRAPSATPVAGVVGLAVVAIALVAIVALSRPGASPVTQQPLEPQPTVGPHPTPERPDESPGDLDLPRRAEAAFQEHRHEAALALVDEALSDTPERAPLHLLRGLILRAMARPEDALMAFTRAAELDASSWTAWKQLGDQGAALGLREAALAAYRRALAADVPPSQRASIAAAMRQVAAQRLPRPEPEPEPQPVPQQPEPDPGPQPAPEPQPEFVPPDPDAPAALPVEIQSKVDALCHEWRFAEARGELARAAEQARYAAASRAAHDEVQSAERTARTRFARQLALEAADLAKRRQFGPAVAKLQQALAACDNAALVAEHQLQIDRWRREAGAQLRLGLENLKFVFDSGAVDEARTRLEAMKADGRFSGYAGSLAKMLDVLDGLTKPDRAIVDDWLASLPASAPFADEAPRPTGPPCKVCEGARLVPCGTCREGQIEGECPDCLGRERTTCGRCKGSRAQPCAPCAGTGRRTEKQIDRDTCPQCDGSGRVGRTKPATCPKCKGRGTVEIQKPVKVDCGDCAARGKQPCQLCGEEGVRPCTRCRFGRAIIPHALCDGSGQAYCAPCRGSGVTAPLAELPRRDPAAAAEFPTTAALFARRADRGIWAARLGGSASTEAAVDRGLDWLASHQDPDGKWDGDGFMKHDPPGEVCTGPAKLGWVDAGLTGLATLAFLGAGHTPLSGKHRTVVEESVQYLMKIQSADGLIGGKRGHYMYNHAICALALAEAYGMTESARVKNSAQKAIEYLVQARNPGMAWRYAERDGDNDLSVTGWCVMALKCAQAAQLEVPGLDEALDQSVAWIESITDEEHGVSGYKSRPPRGWQGGTSSRFQNDELNVNTANTHAPNHTPTAIATMCRAAVGYRPDDSRLNRGAHAVSQMPPVWDTGGGGRLSKVDYYYWYHATTALFQVGGEHWNGWNRSMNAAVVSHQQLAGAARGSWDPIDAWGFGGGRVYATAINVLTLESYYRYAR